MALVTDSLTIPPASSVNATGSSAAARQIAAAASRAVVPLVYGEDRLGGLVLNVLAKAGAPGMLLVQVLWCFGCDSVNDLRLGDEALPGSVTATHYVGDQLAADATLVAAFAAQGIAGVKPLTGYAWSLITMPAALFNGTLNFTARIRGRRCYDPAFDTTAGGAGPQRLADPTTWAYSEVPAVCLGDFMASPVYGCGVAVDWASVKLTGAANRAIVPGSSEMRRVLGVSFIAPASAKDMAETLRAYAGCFLLPGPSGVRLLPDANDAPAAIYRHSLGDIVSIDALELRDLNQAPTAVEVIYTDTSAIPWRDASAVAHIDGAGTTKPWRLSQVRMPGIHRYSQALREATERLNKLVLNDVSTSMVVFDAGIRHDDGDVVTVEHPIGLAMEAMRVTGVNAAGPGRWKLDLVLHSPAGYSDSVVTVAPTVDGSRLLPIAPPSDVADLHGAVSKGIITWTWTPAAERYYLETRLRLNGADWDTATPLWFGRGNTLVQTVGAAGTYTLRARHAVIDGQESTGVATATVTVTPADLDATAPDPTPPPQPAAPTITSGFANAFVEQAAPGYTVGHGHGTTRLYGKVYAGGAPPVFADAKLLAEFAGNAYAYATSVGTTLRLWITWVSRDGYESLTPAGGANGIAVTIGKVGSSDLGDAIVLSQALAPGSVTADKAALDIGGDNLVGNNSFEVDTDGNGLADGWGIYNNDGAGVPTVASRTAGRISGYAQRVTWTGANLSSKGVFAENPGGVRGGWKLGATYVISWYARADAAKAVGMALAWNVAPASSTVLKNPNLSAGWQRYAFRVTLDPSGVEGLGRFFFTVAYGAAVTGWIEFDDVQIEEGDTLSGYQGKLATNTIVAGDGAIANLAITNALIANLAVDDAKIANLSVAKVLAGSLGISQYIESVGYTPGPSGTGYRLDRDSVVLPATSIRGQLTASQINTNGLTIRKPDGSIILDASGVGTAIHYSSVLADGGWLNSNLVPSINQARGTNLFTGNLASPFAVDGASITTASRPDPYGTNNAVEVTTQSGTNGYLYYHLGGLQPGYYTVKLKVLVTSSYQFVVSTTDGLSWDAGGYTIATGPTGSASWVQVVLRQLVGSVGTIDVALGAFHGSSGAVYSSPNPTTVAVSDLWVEREVFGGDLSANRTYVDGGGNIQGVAAGAGTTVSNGLIGINGSGQFYGGGAGTGVTVSNNQLSVTSDGRLLNAGSNQGQVTIGGLGYAGDLNATNGATIGTNLSGSFTQASWDVVMTSAFIRAAHIQQLTASNLTVATLSQVVNGGASSGERIVVSTSLIEGFDSTNARTFRLGKW